MTIEENVKNHMFEEATNMLERAYVPYSKFPVGASLLTAEDELFNGCNIENASFGLSNCAERTAIFKAVSEGKKSFSYLVVTGDTEGPISPCGACRQVIAEFCDADMPVLLTNQKGVEVETTVSKLLPGAFQSGDMA